MRKSIFLASLLTWIATVSQAAVLPVDGTLSFQIGQVGPVALTGSGIGSSSGGVGGAASVPAGLIAGTTTAVVTLPSFPLGVSKVTVPAPFANGAGSFTPNGAMSNDLVAHLFFTNGSPAGVVPLNYVGGGGTGMVLVSGLPLTILGATFTNLGVTPGNPTATDTIMATAAGIPMTLTVTAFDKRGPGGAGTLQLVAPATVKLFGGSLGNLPIIGTLTLHFVPEPGTLLLLGAGAAGIAVFARRRPR